MRSQFCQFFELCLTVNFFDRTGPVSAVCYLACWSNSRMTGRNSYAMAIHVVDFFEQSMAPYEAGTTEIKCSRGALQPKVSWTRKQGEPEGMLPRNL